MYFYKLCLALFLLFVLSRPSEAQRRSFDVYKKLEITSRPKLGRSVNYEKTVNFGNFLDSFAEKFNELKGEVKKTLKNFEVQSSLSVSDGSSDETELSKTQLIAADDKLQEDSPVITARMLEEPAQESSKTETQTNEPQDRDPTPEKDSKKPQGSEETIQEKSPDCKVQVYDENPVLCKDRKETVEDTKLKSGTEEELSARSGFSFDPVESVFPRFNNFLEADWVNKFVFEDSPYSPSIIAFENMMRWFS